MNVLDVDLMIDGDENVVWYSVILGICCGFCKICGFFFFWKMESFDYILIGVGVFDGDIGFIIDQYIYCVDKGDYYDIFEGVLVYLGGSFVIQIVG